MDDLSLTHTKYNCTYHVVFVPKYRRKVMYGQLRQEVGQILSTVCKIKGEVCSDHVHMYIFVSTKMSLSTVMSKLKEKSALMIFDRHPEYRDKCEKHFWARGYNAETIGQVDEDTIMKYIEEQKESSRIEASFKRLSSTNGCLDTSYRRNRKMPQRGLFIPPAEPVDMA